MRKMGFWVLLGLALAVTGVVQGWWPAVGTWLRGQSAWHAVQRAAGSITPQGTNPSPPPTAHKCVPPPSAVGSAVLYTNTACPTGWTQHAVSQGAVTSLPPPPTPLLRPPLPMPTASAPDRDEPAREPRVERATTP